MYRVREITFLRTLCSLLLILVQLVPIVETAQRRNQEMFDAVKDAAGNRLCAVGVQANRSQVLCAAGVQVNRSLVVGSLGDCSRQCISTDCRGFNYHQTPQPGYNRLLNSSSHSTI